MTPCGYVSNADARVFGPPTWLALHLFAQNYPGSKDDNNLPNPPTVAACRKFTSSLPYMLPAHGSYMATLLAQHQDLCGNGTKLQKAMVDAHNNVSAQVRGLDSWDMDKANKHYTTMFKCLTDTQWGKEELCRVLNITASPTQTCTTGPNANCTGCAPYMGTFKPRGLCDDIFSANPRVFGPPTWRMLHIMAEYYPDAPTATVVAACENFTSSLPLMLPCDHCGAHLNETLHMWSHPICTNADTLQTFLVHAHNRVSINVHPNRSSWTRAEASGRYRQTHVCLHNNQRNLGDRTLYRGAIGDRSPPESGDSTTGLMVALVVLAVLVVLAALVEMKTLAGTRRGQRQALQDDTGKSKGMHDTRRLAVQGI